MLVLLWSSWHRLRMVQQLRIRVVWESIGISHRKLWYSRSTASESIGIHKGDCGILLEVLR